MIYLPNQKPPIWSIDPGIIAYNCRKYGFPHPVLAMPMWEGAGNRTFDYSGHGNHGPFLSTTSWTKDGIIFNGTSDYIEVDNPVLGNTSFSVHVLFRWDAAGVEDYILDNGALTNGGFQLFIQTDNTIRVRIDDSGANGGVFDTAATFNNSKVHSPVLVADKTGLAKIYIDGSQDGETLDISGYGDITGTHNLRIGRKDSAGASYLNGIIKGVHIFNNVLSPAQVKFLNDNPYFMYEIPEELYGYVAAEPPPVTFIPKIIMF